MNKYSFDEALAKLASFINYEKTPCKYGSIEYNLDRMRLLLSCLGNPHQGVRFIHIAGTDGKGSTATLTAHLLHNLGMRVGLYTSPHLHTECERIRLNMEQIPQDRFVELFETVLSVLPQAQIAPSTSEHGYSTVFEIYTAMAFLFFKQEKVDFAVVEVGMGGRLDATNVIDPALCIITALGIDHTQHLGHTIEAIAREKLGIIKPGKPVIVSQQPRASEAFLRKQILKRQGIPHFVSEDVSSSIISRDMNGTKFSLSIPKTDIEQNWVHPVPGDHQVSNACSCLLALLHCPGVPSPLPWKILRDSLTTLSLPGRFEVIKQEDTPLFLLDVAHTSQGSQVLLNTMEHCFTDIARRYVIAQLADKNTHNFLEALLRPEDKIIATQVDNPRTKTCDEIYQELIGPLAFSPDQVDKEEDPSLALQKAIDERKPGELIIITGSIYLVAALRAEILNLPD
jgi:dihydrofolate synthase / folylpolyglutamate synthase